MRIIDKETSQLRLNRRGLWFHQGEPFENPKIIDFFHRAIRRDEQGRHYLFNEYEGKTEHVYFEVEDTAYFVARLHRDPAGQGFAALLNTGETVPLEPEDLLPGEDGRMYARVPEGDRALLLADALNDLAEHTLTAEDGLLYLPGRQGERIALGRLDEE